VPRVPISALLGDLRRVTEQPSRLLGDLIRLIRELEQGSALPAITAALHDLRRAVEELVTLLGDARRLVEGLQEGDLLERARAIIEGRNQDGNQQDTKEARLLGELSQLVKRLEEEVTMPDGQPEKGIGEVHDLIIKTDGLLEGVIVGVGKEKNIGLGQFRLTPQTGRPARVMLSAKNEALRQILDFLKPAVTTFAERQGWSGSNTQSGEAGAAPDPTNLDGKTGRP
jgi:hypothetical protein